MSVARFKDLNWRCALAEVTLIFVGITLALSFDNDHEQALAEIEALVPLIDKERAQGG